MSPFTAKASMLAGVLAAMGASVCCLGPLILLSLGIGGAWISDLTALEPARPIFIVASVLFIALAFRKLFLSTRACAPGSACHITETAKRQRLTFWVIAMLSLGLLASPWIAPLFY
jgi:mercuric ion transport protein